LWTVRSFSIKVSELEDLDKLKKLAALDNKSLSEMIKAAIREYLSHHTPPNPQGTLDRALNVNMPLKPSNQCCVEGCKRKAKHHLILQNYEDKKEAFNVCEVHKYWRHQTFKKLVGHKDI
jgi:metal-responsive CopG/Arc/MetJ family transcriptional regulator